MAFLKVSFLTTLAMSISLAFPAGALNAVDRPPFATGSMQLVESFPLGHSDAPIQTWVDIYRTHSVQANALSKRDEISQPIEPIVIDMTPSECTSRVCYSGTYEAPDKVDCDIIVAAQLYNSTGSLSVGSGYTAIVHAGTCAVAFQNPWIVGTNYTMQYNWASLGKIAQGIEDKCFQPDNLSIGGACKISQYLKYNFQNLVISLQTYIPQMQPQAQAV